MIQECHSHAARLTVLGRLKWLKWGRWHLSTAMILDVAFVKSLSLCADFSKYCYFVLRLVDPKFVPLAAANSLYCRAHTFFSGRNRGKWLVHHGVVVELILSFHRESDREDCTPTWCIRIVFNFFCIVYARLLPSKSDWCGHKVTFLQRHVMQSSTLTHPCTLSPVPRFDQMGVWQRHYVIF